jgi:signal peptide peptidase SppA
MESEKELLLWAGTEESLREYTAALAAATQMAIKDPKAFTDAQSTPEQSPLLSMNNGLARISIKGPLVNSDNPFLAYFGVISYNEIRRALIGAVNSGANDIVLDIHSGGGHVSGVSDTARLIAQINKNVMPVTAYTDGTMASAAYWLGSSAGKVYASDVSVVGSIGVLMVHMDHSELLKEMKIKATIVRSGKYKALVNGFEPLSKTAKEEMQAQVDAIDKIFVTHVAESRGVSYEVAQAEMAQGREFLAEAAVTAGLIDGISSYDAVIGGLTSKRKNLDKSKPLKNNKMKPQYGANNMTQKNALTEADIAALAAGGAAAAVDLTPEQTAAAEALAKTETDAKVVADAVAAQAKAADEATAKAKADAEAVAAAAKKDTELVAYLRAELKDREAKLLEATVTVRDLTAKVTSMDATHSALVAIAGDSANNMRVALKSAKVDVKTLTPEALITQHKQLVADFSAQYKVGGVAAVGAEAAATEKKTNSAVHSARIKATRGPAVQSK